MSAVLKIVPDAVSWLEVLREECKKSSQAKVAKRLGYSSSVISQALECEYKGDLKRLEECVLGEFMGKTVDCPILGTINRNDCLGHQKREFAATNSQRVQLFRACHGSCPHSQVGTKEGD